MPNAETKGAVQRGAMRPALGLDELLELLVQHQLLAEGQSREVASRATTLKSSVLKERVGSVRSQAASRYDVSPAELVAAAGFPNPDPKQGKVDENAIAKVLAKASGAPYLRSIRSRSTTTWSRRRCRARSPTDMSSSPSRASATRSRSRSPTRSIPGCASRSSR